VDEHGHLHLDYWPGNDVAKGKEIDLDLQSCIRVPPEKAEAGWRSTKGSLEVNQPYGGGLVLLANHFSLEKGIIVEGKIEVHAPAKRWSGIGVYVEQDAGQNLGTAVLVQTRGYTEIGPLRHGKSFMPDDAVQVGIPSGKACRFRLLVRQSLLEFYLDDRLVQCYSLPEPVTGRLGLVFESGRAIFRDLSAWEINV